MRYKGYTIGVLMSLMMLSFQYPIIANSLDAGNTVILPFGSTWKYLDNGSDQGDAWIDPSFDDSGWNSGPAQLGYGDNDEATVVSFGGDQSNKYITTYYRTTINVANPVELISGVELSLIRDDGAIVYVNGTEVFRSNMPAGSVDYTTAATGTVGGNSEDEPVISTIPASVFVVGENIIAVEIHQRSGTSSDTSFDMKLEAFPSGDSDNDGILDVAECPVFPCRDSDNDMLVDYLDVDDDNDGILTINEDFPNADGDPSNDDVDADSLANYLDTDSDGDTLLDADECAGGAPCANSDSDNLPDYLDTDSDNDTITDTDDLCPIEAGTLAMGGCPDSDNDGIGDGDDLCPNEPGDPALDGCPDGDNDGVADINDDCPDTPGSTGANGCPDADGDGVQDADDLCINTPGIACTDGCPDGDNDCVADTDDDCPMIPGNITANGCPDADEDGVQDADDSCPMTPGNITANGCPDADGDSIEDADDACPDDAGVACTDGCPDSDGDCVGDPFDECPEIAGSTTAAGCPDFDGDGVQDAEDLCVSAPGIACTDGCPDGDNDCVADIDDDCPMTPGNASANGCPDMDGDGILDEDDACPEDFGVTSANGCPDADGDSIQDAEDLCVDTPGIACADGCPDSDDDCVGDPFDECPGVVGSTTAAGCPDVDGDGVQDAEDLCVNIPGSVCASGCPDGDNDCVTDTDDDCPLEFGSVCANGCPDADNDCILDIDDACPNDAGVISANGCPDADGDGIQDADDLCPDDFGVVSANGCPDADLDTVSDFDDLCPSIAGSVCANGCPDVDNDCVGNDFDDCLFVPGEISANGCPDADGDSVQDADDVCPNDFGPVCTDGCPDGDNDCIADTEDACPNETGDITANGCPDADGDGFQDTEDACPNEAGDITANGCPDADGDGFQDADDTCPNDAGVVCTEGCPDPDSDCIGSQVDACPEVYGTASGEGCPRIFRGPYLQKGTPTSVVVRWRTDFANEGAVYYGTSPGNLTNMQPGGITTEHEIEVTGLQPGTVYYYAIGDVNGTVVGNDNDYYFKTSPAFGDEGEYRLWVLGDCGTANSNARSVRDAYYNFTGNRHTDAMLMLGDNAYNVGSDTEFQYAVFENMYEEKLQNTVLWSCPGNHEYYNGYTDAQTQTGPYYSIHTFPTNGEAGGLASGTEAYYSFDYGNVHVVSLDSHDSDKSVGGSMLTWLENDLAQTTQKWIIAIWHHPAYSKGSHNSDTETAMVQMRENVMPILEDYGVDLVLSGHSHSYERSYMMKEHHGFSSSWNPDLYGFDAGTGKADVDSVYTKYISGVFAGEGVVYITAGSSGKISNAALNHPAMYANFVELGSVVLDVHADTMNVKFINNSMTTRDYFTVVKNTEEYGVDYDTDGDSVADITECPDGFPCQNSDGDDLTNMYDADDDNDGIPTLDENNAIDNNVDNDALPNYLDTDSDNDGLTDLFECPSRPCIDTDEDGYPNYLDTDSDNDGVLDSDDLCYLVAGSITTNGCPDMDADGIEDADDECPQEAGIACTNGCPDEDEDCIKDSEDSCPAVFGTVGNDGCPRVLRGPYLQKVTPTSIVVKWRTDVPTTTGVIHRKAGTGIDGFVADDTMTTEHEIEITGLEAETKYYYRFGGASAMLQTTEVSRYFITSPEIGDPGDYRFWVLGDCGTANDNARSVRDAFYNYIGNSPLDGMLMLGDNAYNIGTDAQYQDAVFENMYEERLKNTTLWSCPGNHDYYGGADAQTQTGVYYDIFTFPKNGEAGGLASGTEAYYSFDYGDIHFVSLDSHDSDRSIGGPMLTWLENDLAQTTQRWIVAIWHHPPYTKGSHNSDTESQLIEMRENAVPILEAYGVDLVLSGHSHSYERSKLIHGHYDNSNTFDENTMLVQDGAGQLVNAPYCKQEEGVFDGDGTVYITAGSSGRISGGTLNHPVMYTSLNELGSLALQFRDSVLLVRFLTPAGQMDYFRIQKKTDLLTDADNDGILDSDECVGGRPCPDEDEDGIPDFKDTDSDGDGLTDAEECPDGVPCPQTTVGIPDYLNTDSDGDGLTDAEECPNGVPCPDSNNNGIFDYQETDSDSDGFADGIDDCATIPGVASANGCPDADGDSVQDALDDCPEEPGFIQSAGCPCLKLNLKIMLEGPFDSLDNQMTTYLATERKLLPGQTPNSELIAPTPAGHPYSVSPWNYNGPEGSDFTDSDYSDNVVDWVLVSLRSNIYKTDEIGLAAALIMKDGTIETVLPCAVETTETGPFYIVIEHRNHMGIMSPIPVQINNGEINFDFTTQDSFRDATSVGQKELAPGIWGMFAGDMDQISDENSYDISAPDKAIWSTDNGLFDQYIPSDINLDGNTNGGDKIQWEENNGNSSRVPKD